MNTVELRLMHHDCSQHRALIERSKVVGCFYCQQMYSPLEIVEWIDDGKTALCPKCGIDTVLPDSVFLADQVLKAMYEYWFAPVDEPR
jgi:NAD-dependent SIR2 family protein deacetylase